jgi:alanine racemase
MSNTWAELDLGILRANLQNLQKGLSSSTKIIFVVKSNAYGHGILPVSQCAWKCGVEWFAVSNITEALTLREILPDAGILVAGVISPDDVQQAVENNLVPIIISEKHAAALSTEAESRGIVLRCHAKVDTGMGRLGFPWEDASEVLLHVARLPGLDVCGICTHFASASCPDREFADTQARRFNTVAGKCEQEGLSLAFKHISNSGAVLCNRAWNMDGVRPGILLYGYGRNNAHHPRQDGCVEIETKPFMQWKTRIIQVKKVPAGYPVSYEGTFVTKKETTIAVLDVGYADGYSRALSNCGIVIVGGQRCPVVGRITMNLTMIDAGSVPAVNEGDEAVLIGSQGSESIWADEVAQLADTIPYEVLTSIRTITPPRIVQKT